MGNIITNTVSIIKNWWLFLLTGVLFIVGSFYVLQSPGDSYVALSWMFSALVLINGLSSSFFSIKNRYFLEGWGWYLAGGIFESIYGIFLLSYPEMSMMVLPLFVGFWILFRGVQMISTSIDLKQYGISNWGWLMFLGIMVTVLASFMVIYPVVGFFNIIYLTFIALFMAGVSNIATALKLKKIKSKTIDKVEDFKKDLKRAFNQDLKNFRENIVEAYDKAPEESKKKIDEAFEEYERKVK